MHGHSEYIGDRAEDGWPRRIGKSVLDLVRERVEPGHY